MKLPAIFGIGLFLLVIGIALGYYLGISTRSPKDFDWKELSLDPRGKGYGFILESLFNSDIALPDIKKLSGKSKFLSSIKAGKDEVHLGYIVSVDVEKLNLEKVPEKYKEERKEKYKAGEVTRLPIQEVVYQVSFKFTLKDKDGFELIKLEGPKHMLDSGKDNRFQENIKQSISRAVVDRTKDIVLYMTVEKCVTCR